MSAYIVFIRERTTDPAEMAIYSRDVGASVHGHPLTPLVAYGRYEVLEGPEIEGGVLLEFPSFAEAKAWYESPAYVEVRKHRFKGAEYRAVIFEGLQEEG